MNAQRGISHGVINLSRMYMFCLLALFYIMVQYILIIYDNSTTPRDILENVRQPYPGNISPSYGAWIFLQSAYFSHRIVNVGLVFPFVLVGKVKSQPLKTWMRSHGMSVMVLYSWLDLGLQNQEDQCDVNLSILIVRHYPRF